MSYKMTFKFNTQDDATKFYDETFWGYGFIPSTIRKYGKSVTVELRRDIHKRMLAMLALECNIKSFEITEIEKASEDI